MLIDYQLGRAKITVDGDTTLACWDKIASASEILSAASTCGACGSNNTMLNTREYQGNHFREAVCLDCGCKLAFGQRRSDGEIYPRRRDKEGNTIGGNGWVKWQPRDANDDDVGF